MDFTEEEKEKLKFALDNNEKISIDSGCVYIGDFDFSVAGQDFIYALLKYIGGNVEIES